jgi:cytochrome c-type biogenesis protein CcmH/NrfF
VLLMLAGAPVRAQEQPPQMAQVQQGSLMHTARNDRERALFGKYKCLCGTCSHSLDECVSDGCGSAEMRRVEIQKMIDSGMSDEAIAGFEVQKYGEETLRTPLDKGYRRLVYVLPVAVLIGAVGVLVAFARRTSGKARPGAPTPTGPQVADGDDYESRLDDELDELD